MKYDVNIKSLNCPNCGGKLDVTGNTTDVVFCGACGTKCVITGLNVNEEILKKNNINSGIPLVESSSRIHNTVFSFITSAPNFPINVLENLVIKEVKKVSVPAYLFTVSAFASYTYEAGNIRQQDNISTNSAGQVVTTHNSYTEWTQMSSIANDTRTVVVSGNNMYMNAINAFYGTINPAQLVDIEYLHYPEGTITELFNVPYASAFNQYAKPIVDRSISDSALRTLQGKMYRNFYMGQANIQKEYEARISLGIYIVQCTCYNQQFFMYLNADATRYYTTVQAPFDEARLSYINYLIQQKNGIKSTWTHDVFHGGFSKAKANKAMKKDEKNRIQEKINSISQEPAIAKAEFLRRGCRLKGVYSNGYDNFVWESYNSDVPIMLNGIFKCS